MGNTYRAVSPLGEAIYGKDVFTAEFTAAEERDHLVDGHLELVARPYRVLSDRFAAGGKDDVVDLALPMETEAALLGVHIERIDVVKPTKKAAKAVEKKG